MQHKTAVQIDFDGTVTVKDVSFLLLDKYAEPAWRNYLEEYSSGKITVGAFNKIVFAMVKADRKTMTDFVLSSPDAEVRPGLKELLDYCRKKNYKTLIVSNGLYFYIEALLEKLGVHGLEVHAAENVFYKGGMNVRYLGPDGKEVDTAFKEAWAADLRRQDYDIIYIGNGTSDIHPARQAQQVFACEDLLTACQKENLAHYPFNDFRDVLKILKKLEAER